MAKTQTIFGTHFCGNEISDYGKQNGFVDYATLAKSFDAVMCNDILSTTYQQRLRSATGTWLAVLM